MPIIKSKPIEKFNNGQILMLSEHVIVSDSEYRTKGEIVAIVKDIPNCKLIIDHSTTTHITIKALTHVLIIPSVGRIDEIYDEIFLNNGACVELLFSFGNWYILSSDGLKLE